MKAVGLFQIKSQRGQHGPQALRLVGGRLFVYPVDGRLMELKEMFRHALIGGQHKGFDEGLADPLLPADNLDRSSVLIADNTALPSLQIQTPPQAAALGQFAGQTRHFP